MADGQAYTSGETGVIEQVFEDAMPRCSLRVVLRTPQGVLSAPTPERGRATRYGRREQLLVVRNERFGDSWDFRIRWCSCGGAGPPT
jgi:hypothetical protein